MLILGIETSCDETSVAIIEGRTKSKKAKILSNVVASSLSLHSSTGGIIPENAAREQIKYIIPVIKKAIENCKLKIENLDGIAVTYGPGLIGSLLIGVETAKTLSYIWNKPLIPVNHLFGHIYANWLAEDNKKEASDNQLSSNIDFPAVALIVSGGHTDLVLIKNHGKIMWLGGTRDDAAGEALDKIGRLLNLPYPGGPYIEKAALVGNPNKYIFPRPLIGSKDFDFSFSGLKTAVFREIQAIDELNNEAISDISAGTQSAIVDVLVKKTLKAAIKYKAKSILLGGGVAANEKLRSELELKIENLKLKIPLFVPEKRLCTDNGAMIAAAAYFNYKQSPWQKLDADPSLYFDPAPLKY